MMKTVFVSVVSALVLLQAAADAGAAGRSAAEQALYERAWKECKSWKYYPDGAVPHINYKKGWFRCRDYRSGKGRKR